MAVDAGFRTWGGANLVLLLTFAYGASLSPIWKDWFFTGFGSVCSGRPLVEYGERTFLDLFSYFMHDFQAHATLSTELEKSKVLQ
ncbi:hypothetical protein ACSAZL_20655 [Methanosarcina sp. T3]|uniref:hypothetical protein n=1 Tax=Methanosarcina sp. T3 TaxID=3439062 RepID=UPI003F8614AF